MSSVDWEEVKRLAADFQRAQLSSSAQRLSERNCIEIISRLIEDKLLEVVFTTDGKEYITPQHLIRQIRDELDASGGRINLVEIAKNLTVDLQVVSKRATEIERSDNTIRIINGQMISNIYVDSLCAEINEKLQFQGQISVGDLTSQYDLPSEFLLSIIEKNLKKSINGIQDKQDRQIFFTQSYVERNLAIVRGALMAITRPITTAQLINLCGTPERLFYSAIESLSEKKEIPGILTGKQRTAGSYVPHIYTKSQMDWVNSFLSQNGYLEYQALSRLGLSDPVNFIQKNFVKSNLLQLSTVAVSSIILEQIEASVDEATQSASFVKLMQILPTIFDDTDAEILLNKVLQKKGNANNFHVFNTTTLVTDQYMRALIKDYNNTVDVAAKDFVESGAYIKSMMEKTQHSRDLGDDKPDVKVDKKEERRKKAAEGKSGGGAQGRETKTKSTKKKYLKNKHQQEDSDNEDNSTSKSNQKLEILNRKIIFNGLRNVELIQDEDDDSLQNDVTDYLYPLLNRKALEQSRILFESTIASANQSRRKKLSDLQEKLSELLLNIRIFEKGVKQFDNADVNLQLTKYLLKSLCTDVVNEIFLYVAHENSKLFEDSTDLTTEQRMKVLNEIPVDMREPLLRLHKSLNGTSISDFLSAAEVALSPAVSDILVVKHDKKKERPQMLHLRQQLIEQLNVCEDPALALHLTCLIVFQGYTQNAIHASGKFVSNILSLLKTLLEGEVYDTLRTYHDLVLQYLSKSEDRATVGSALDELLPRIKEIALSAKKAAGKKERSSSTTSN